MKSTNNYGFNTELTLSADFLPVAKRRLFAIAATLKDAADMLVTKSNSKPGSTTGGGSSTPSGGTDSNPSDGTGSNPSGGENAGTVAE